MKKVIVVCMVLAMMMAMAISAFASPGAFVDSPSLNPAPELVEGKNQTDACPAQIIVTAYGDRNDLSVEQRQKLEAAYTAIVGAQDLSTLNAKISEIAEKMGVSVSTLAVSDLFDISATGCDDHTGHGDFDITLKADTLKNFVCLLHYYNGEWRVVENAEVTNDGNHLEFNEDEFSPFAIVVSSEPIPEAKSGVSCWLIALFILLLLILIAIIVWYCYKRSKKADEE